MSYYYKVRGESGPGGKVTYSSPAEFKTRLATLKWVWQWLNRENFMGLHIERKPGWELLERAEYERLHAKYGTNKENE